MKVTVSMPTWRTPPALLRRAVQSVLGQTHRDLMLVVVGDGEIPSLGDVKDSRLVVWSLPENRGRYFIDAVVARAAQTPWFTVHDSDDWSDPHRLERMLARSSGAEVVAGAETVHTSTRASHKLDPKRFNHYKMDHLFHISALYRTEVIDGLIHPGFRVGYDTLLSNLLTLSTDVRFSPEPHYHRCFRPGSLTNSPATGMSSPTRRRAVVELNALFQRAQMGESSLPRFRHLIESDAGVLMDLVNQEAQRLRRLIDQGSEPTPSLSPQVGERVEADDVVVTILTGGRPELLRQTLMDARREYPGFLESAYVVVLHNGGDEETTNVLRRYEDIIDTLTVNGSMAGIGSAISQLAAMSQWSQRRYWLHLEDDWAAMAGGGDWMKRSKAILDEHPNVAQVRLRRDTDTVLARHMVTKRPLNWEPHGEWSSTPDAHLTFNPSLVRVQDISKGWPCSGEADAQVKWHSAGKRSVAQLHPGVFTHIGDADSLRIARERSGRA